MTKLCMYTPRRTKLQFKMIFKEDPVPIASAQQYHLYISILFKYLYIFSSEKVHGKCAPNRTIDKKSGEYAPIPLNIVCTVLHYLLFLYKKMDIFTNFFFKILARYSPNCTIF